MQTLERSITDTAVRRIRPIFIHAMWRTGSTYIWNQFRKNATYRAYYEPLHEDLWKVMKSGAELTGKTAAKATQMRHPELELPYFAEYPFCECGGVVNFQKRFSYQRYSLDENGKDDALRLYISYLIARAVEAGQIPVFKFNRSLLRAGWMAKNFPSTSIVLLRRPIDIWRSFCRLDGYFAATLCLIVGQNRDHPILNNLANIHDIPTYYDKTVHREINFYRRVARRRSETLYRLFFQFYVLTAVHALLFSDCVIDVNAITKSLSVRACLEHRLSELGAGISLTDCCVPIYEDLSVAERQWMAYEQEGRQAVAALFPGVAQLINSKLPMLEPYLSDYHRELFATFSG